VVNGKECEGCPSGYIFLMEVIEDSEGISCFSC
jgi:hypothetical protein